MFKNGPVPAFVHGLLEYVVGVLLIAAPFVLSFDSDTATGISIAAGVVVLIAVRRYRIVRTSASSNGAGCSSWA